MAGPIFEVGGRVVGGIPNIAQWVLAVQYLANSPSLHLIKLVLAAFYGRYSRGT